MEDFAGWFRRQLAANGWDRSDFAAKAGRSYRTVSSWYTGERKPDPIASDLIADVLGIDRDTVLAVAGHRPRDDDDVDETVERLCGKIRRISWTEERLGLYEPALDRMLEIDRKRKQETR